MRTAWGSAVVVLALVAPAAAQTESAQAEALFRQGKQLMAQKKYAEACEAFDGSQKLEPSLATLLNQAGCREQNGQLVTAWGLFLEAERQTRGATDKQTQQLHKVASDRAAKLEPKLSKLTIVVGADAKVDGLQITRNKEKIDTQLWNQTLPVDGGTYTIVAKAAGRSDFSTSITIEVSGDTKSVTIPKLAEATADVSTTTTATTEPIDTPTDVTPASGGSSKVVPIVLGVGAVALLGGALGLELSARSTYDEAKVEIDDDEQISLWESANRKRYIAEGLAVAGVACAGVAVWLFVRSSRSSETATARRGVSVEPMFARGGGGVLLQGRY